MRKMNFNPFAAISLVLSLTLSLSACNPAAEDTPSDLVSPPTAVQPSQSPESPSLVPVPESDSPWQVDESLLTDDYLISLVIDFEVSIGQDGFFFNEEQQLTESQLYTAFLLLSDYDELVEKYWNADDENFYFTSDGISAKLSEYFKTFTFDITQDYDYDAETKAIVTPLASGFGGDRYMKVTDKEISGNIVTFTADFYEDYERQGAVFMTKTYGIEFYKGGWYYLYAVEV